MATPPLLCIADIIAVVYYKRIADWKVVAKLLPTAILGFFDAIFVDKLIPTNEFRQLMGWTLALAVMIWSEWQGESLDEKVIVLGSIRTARRFYHDDWQCRRAGAVGLSALDAQGKMEYIGINARLFLVVNLLKVPLQIFVWDNIS